MLAAGIVAPANLIFDGKIHRFATLGSRNRSCWYVLHSDGIPGGAFGNWAVSDESHIFRASATEEFSSMELLEFRSRVDAARALRDAERARLHASTAGDCAAIWAALPPADPDHPYLTAKNVLPHCARQTEDGRLVLPLLSAGGEISSLQYIASACDEFGSWAKPYHPGGVATGCFCLIGEFDPQKTTYIAEGFSTGATIHEITGCLTVVAFSANSISSVCATICQSVPREHVVIVADNDKSEVGLRAAESAAAKHGCRYLLGSPHIGQDANDYAASGGDLLDLLNPPRTGWLVHADDFCAQPAPMKWLIKSWLQCDALQMLVGPSGCGKTFLALDWSCRIAGGLEAWAGCAVKAGPVVYLAGEGHYGLRSRLSAWRTRNPGQLKLWVSATGCDLDKPDGYLMARDAVLALDARPVMIVVDTLHCFLSGDENSAQDARTMINACRALMRDFACSVLLVHHTGVAVEAQARARGSSSWRGALDIEIGVTTDKATKALTIESRKCKDGAPPASVTADLETVTIDGWLTDEGGPATSVILRIIDTPPSEAVSALGEHAERIKLLGRAWFGTGHEMIDGMPYLSRSGLKNWLEGEGWSTAAVKNAMRSDKSRLIGGLQESEIIAPAAAGWIIKSETIAAKLMLQRGE